MINRLFPQVLIFCVSAIVLTGCAGASVTFSGSNIPPEVSTIAINQFFNDALDGPANLEIQYTESLKEYFQRNTKLVLVIQEADLVLEGKITGYRVTPMAASAGSVEISQLQRLTVTVQVTYTNNFEEDKDFEQSFSYFQDFPASQALSDVEAELLPVIFEQINFDIFNKTVADW